MEENSETWLARVKRPEGLSREIPQMAYTGLKMLLQQEWQFLSTYPPELGHKFLLDLIGLRIEEVTYSLHKRIT